MDTFSSPYVKFYADNCPANGDEMLTTFLQSEFGKSPPVLKANEVRSDPLKIGVCPFCEEKNILEMSFVHLDTICYEAKMRYIKFVREKMGPLVIPPPTFTETAESNAKDDAELKPPAAQGCSISMELNAGSSELTESTVGGTNPHSGPVASTSVKETNANDEDDKGQSLRDFRSANKALISKSHKVPRKRGASAKSGESASAESGGIDLVARLRTAIRSYLNAAVRGMNLSDDDTKCYTLFCRVYDDKGKSKVQMVLLCVVTPFLCRSFFNVFSAEEISCNETFELSTWITKVQSGVLPVRTAGNRTTRKRKPQGAGAANRKSAAKPSLPQLIPAAQDPVQRLPLEVLLGQDHGYVGHVGTQVGSTSGKDDESDRLSEKRSHTSGPTGAKKKVKLPCYPPPVPADQRRTNPDSTSPSSDPASSSRSPTSAFGKRMSLVSVVPVVRLSTNMRR